MVIYKLTLLLKLSVLNSVFAMRSPFMELCMVSSEGLSGREQSKGAELSKATTTKKKQTKTLKRPSHEISMHSLCPERALLLALYL